ncbi:MAG: AI-2E family transporter, partial [Pigmentiphaga sp.]
PVHRRLERKLGGRKNLAALVTLLICFLIVIIPLALLSAALVREGSALYATVKGGQLDVGGYVAQIMSLMPDWLRGVLDRFGIYGLDEVKTKLTSAASELGQLFATQALNIGQNTAQFIVSFGVMLYLLFFLLRDGPALSAMIYRAIPLAEEQKRRLADKFLMVVRATVKGNIAVAATQGLLGGIIFWILNIQGAVLWGVVMAFLSLLPAIGAALIWAPVAIYFLATGDIGKAAILTAYGILVIGLVDNVLRPILVGKDTRLPDYVVLIATLGGMTVFGINGFVIGPLIAALFISAWGLLTEMREDASTADSGVLLSRPQPDLAAAPLPSAQVAADPKVKKQRPKREQ